MRRQDHAGRVRVRAARPLYVEASTIVRSLGIDALETDDPEGFAYAMRALEQRGHDVVPREIVERYGDRLDGPFVISGLRDVAEIAFIRRVIPRFRVLLVEASERTRFERHVRRARPGAETALDEFRARDSRQDEFGLLPVAEDLADIRIVNEGKIDEYHRQINSVIAIRVGEPGVDLAAHPRHGPSQHQLYRCLKILQSARTAMQCDEIEARSNDPGVVPIRHNNANKVLKAFPSLSRRLEAPSGLDLDQDSARVRYEITPAGVIYVGLLEKRGPTFGADDSGG